MKEYNWREEREKYRLDFQKQSSGSNKNMPAGTTGKRSSARPYITGVIIALVVVAIVGGVLLLFQAKDSFTLLAEAAEKNKNAVGLVTLTIERRTGEKITLPIGTAWAFSEKHFATNGHVANSLKKQLSNIKQRFYNNILNIELKKHNCKSADELLKKSGPDALANIQKRTNEIIKDVRVDIIINGTSRKSHSVTHVQIHKDYGVVGTKFDPDVAVLTILGKNKQYFEIADSQTLKNIKSGLPIAYLGFPMELLMDDNVNIDNPVASMQNGIVVAVSDFELKDSKDGNFLLRHNLPSTGGASGSPIFNQEGKVIAVHNAGNIIFVDTGRAPSAAQINYGVRVDLLNGMGNAVHIRDFLK